MEIDFASSIEDVRIHTGWCIGGVLARVVHVHLAASDVQAAQALCRDILKWADSARQAAACRQADPHCEAALKLLDLVVQRLRGQPAGDVTSEWLRAAAREIDAQFGDELRRLSSELCPDSVWDSEEFGISDEDLSYFRRPVLLEVPPSDPEYQRGDPEYLPVDPLDLPDETESPPTDSEGTLGLDVDEVNGNVYRAGHNHGQPTHFDKKSAMWHWFIVAYRAGSRGATKAQVDNGYPGEKTSAAMRQARARAQERLRPLGIGFEDRFPLRIVEIHSPTTPRVT